MTHDFPTIREVIIMHDALISLFSAASRGLKALAKNRAGTASMWRMRLRHDGLPLF